MNKEEFFNFLSLISAFKDVVIGEDTNLIEEEPMLLENEVEELNEINDIDNDVYPINHEPTKRNLEESNNDKLNPEEWDPW